MQYIRLSLSLLAFTLVSACGDATSPSSEAQTGSATSSKPGPWDTLAALPPEDQAYGLDVYTENCASCHGFWVLPLAVKMMCCQNLQASCDLIIRLPNMLISAIIALLNLKSTKTLSSKKIKIVVFQFIIQK